MGVVKTILLVAFVIICILTILLVLIQNEDSNGMGTPFGGGQSAAFGAHSASVLTKTTVVLVVLFFIVAFFLAFTNKSSKSAKTDVTEAVEQVIGNDQTDSSVEAEDWLEKELSSGESSETVIVDTAE